MAPRYRNITCGRCGGERKGLTAHSMKALRRRTGMTLRGFARHIGVSAAYLSEVESGKKSPSRKVEQKYQALAG